MALPEHKARAAELLKSPEAREIINNVHRNSLEEGAAGLGRIKDKRAEMDLAREGMSHEAVAAAAAEEMKDPIKKHLLPMALKYGARVLPAAVGGYVGNQIGGTEGMAIGGLVGTGLGVAMGKPGTAMGNRMRMPGVQKLAWSVAQKALVDAPQRLGKFAPILAAALSKGPEKFATEWFLLNAHNAEARKTFKGLEDQPDDQPAQ